MLSKRLECPWLRAATCGLVVALMAATPCPAQPQTTVFSTDFESGLPAQFTAPGSTIDGVQGWAGLGAPASQFSGGFLRYTSVPLFDTQLSLTGLPAHDHLNLKFLLALIDSWDGTELLQVLVDGNLIFSHWFQLATGDASSYVPAPGALLSSGTNLGFSAGSFYGRDRAYDMGVEPVFIDIPHTAGSVDIVWRLSAVSGPAANQWQGGADESWAIDNVAVEVIGSVAGVDDGVVPAFGLARVPNPIHGGPLTIEFSLGSGTPGTLALFDIAGRRVRAREVGSLGAGRHTIELDTERALMPGVYLVRLGQGTQTDARRVVVLP